MGYLYVQLCHCLEHGRRRRGARGHEIDRVADTRLQFRGGGRHQVHDDRRTAHMGYAIFANGIENSVGAHRAQTDTGAVERGDGPRETPAVAMKHRQCPEVHRVRTHVPGQRIRHRVQVGAAVVSDYALGVAGGARCIAKRDRAPLVIGQAPAELGIAALDKVFVLDITDQLTVTGGRIIDIDYLYCRRQLRQRCLYRG